MQAMPFEDSRNESDLSEMAHSAGNLDSAQSCSALSLHSSEGFATMGSWREQDEQ
jgi:hypothetical protein